jgi:hypothetical protein
VTGLNGPIAYGCGENSDAGRNATQHGGKRNSSRRTNLSDLAHRLVHVTIAGNHQGQASYTKRKYDACYRSEEQPIVLPHLEPKVIKAGNRGKAQLNKTPLGKSIKLPERFEQSDISFQTQRKTMGYDLTSAILVSVDPKGANDAAEIHRDLFGDALPNYDSAFFRKHRNV